MLFNTCKYLLHLRAREQVIKNHFPQRNERKNLKRGAKRGRKQTSAGCRDLEVRARN